jgi:ribosomal protein S18 acetylase RimI-like enzyme
MLSHNAPVVRPANIADVPDLVAIENACFDTDRISARSFRGLVTRATAATLVVESGGTPAGYAMLLFRKGTAMARLYSIAVAPQFSGQGLGQRLIEAAEKEAFRRGKMLLRLEVRADNLNAIRLYRRLGYRPIGRYLDYYADHADALRFEKTLRGGLPLTTQTPYYEQSTDFTCAACCLMMALGRLKPGYRLDPVNEIRLWRQATTVFMMSGPGGCEPHGLAVAAHDEGLDTEIFVSETGSLFLDSVRSAEKRMVMELSQQDFRQRVRAKRIRVHRRAFTSRDIQRAVAKGELAAVLVSAYHMFGKKVPHWVLVHGDDGSHMLVHDPWVEDEVGETRADAANLPVPYDQFERMSRFGKANLRAAVVFKKRSMNN